MGESIEFIKDRAVKSISAAKQVSATWIWEEKTIPDYQAQLDGVAGNHLVDPPVLGQEDITARAEQAMLQARGVWDGALDLLHRRTMQGVGMAKTKFRADPAKLSQLEQLTAHGTSRTETLAEALAWESAWTNVAPTWSPLPANTLATFKTLRQQCNETLQTNYRDARAAWRQPAEVLAQMGLALEDTNEAWYADALRTFAEGTAEGDMIRGTVPTTYTPPAKPATAAATPAKPTP